MRNKLFNFFKGNKRSVKAKKNIIASFAIKGVSIVVGFMMIRITLEYLDKTEYGIWVTISSFLTWFTFFEIGLGNGLKNKLAEALAKKDYVLAKTHVSTTYALLSIIISIVSILFLIGNNFIDWTKILNTDSAYITELTTVSYIVFLFFFLQFVVKLIGNVLRADQRTAMANALGPIGNVVSLLLIFILTKTTDGSLVYISWVFSVIPVLVLISVSIYFYKNEYYNIAPSLRFVDFNHAKELVGLGLKFFLIQISALIMFQSSNILITQFYGPSEVTPFHIAYKLFSTIMMVFTIVVTPYWTAFTEAWVVKDYLWVKKTIKNLLYIWLSIAFVSFIVYLFSDLFFDFWLGTEKMKSMNISDELKLSLLIYFLLLSFGGIFNMFINGVGKLAIQMYSLLIGALIFIPLSYFFIKVLHWGVQSVVIASILSNFYSPFVAPIQYFKLINGKADGIWNK